MIAVTGATGLLGSYVVRELLRQDKPFKAFKRKGSDLSLLAAEHSQITWCDVDLLDPVSIVEGLQDVTRIIHTAAFISFNPRKAKQVIDVNVMGTRNLINACLTTGVTRFVHVSSVAALGRQKGQTIIDENNKWVESPYHSVYAKGKYLAELEVFRGQEEGLSTVIINPSVILAEGNWNSSSAKLFKYVWNQKPFYFDGVINYVDVSDVVSLIFRLLESPIEGERFIVSAGKTSNKDLFDRIAANFQKRAPSIRLPVRILRAAVMVESLRARLIGVEPQLTRELARLAGLDYTFDNRKIRETLDFNFQPIDKTLQRCCGYYMDKEGVKKLVETP
jgi:nucleoside-diphosphate-sugar epimerase